MHILMINYDKRIIVNIGFSVTSQTLKHVTEFRWQIIVSVARKMRYRKVVVRFIAEPDCFANRPLHFRASGRDM